MANIEISKRTGERNIDSTRIDFLYEEVLLYYETDGRDFSGYNLNKNPFLTKLEDKLQFKLVDDMKKVQKGNPDFFYFKKSKDSKIESWSFHLRNAIAHNRIFKKKDSEALILEDVFNSDLSMYAEVSSFEKLKSIITEIKKSYKKDENN